MAIPSEILRLVEEHACFSGCYGVGNDLLCFVQPGQTPEDAFDAQCEDCLRFRVGGLASRFSKGMTYYQFAEELTEHVRAHRRYALSFGGYHTQGGGFWLSAAYWDKVGLFLLKSDRGSNPGAKADVDLLIKAFTTGVAAPPHSAMLDRAQYVSHRVYLDVVSLPAPMSAPFLLASRYVSQTPRPGHVAVTLAEYLPVARAATAGASAAPPSAPAPRRALKLGDRCDICGQIVTERPLLTSVYLACGCDSD